MKRLLTLLLILFTGGAMAQYSLQNVSGTVKEDTGDELSNAIIYFTDTQDNTKVYPVMSDENGYFRQELPNGEYQFYVSYIGQDYFLENNHIKVENNDIELSTIFITLEEEMLEAMEIVAQRPFVSYKGSDTIYNLSANPAAEGGNVLDGIKLLPGIQMGNDNGLSVFGFYNLTVAVNGQVLRLSKDEVSTYLASLSVKDIHSVEVIRQPGPEYGRVDSVLNIVMKKNLEEDLNIFFSTDVTYRTLWSENARMRINLNQGKTKNFLSYSFFDNRRKESLETSLGNDHNIVEPYRGHNIQLGSELEINPKHLIGIRSLFSISGEKMTNNIANQMDMNRKAVTSNLYHSLSKEQWFLNSNIDFAYHNSNRNYFINGTTSGNSNEIFHHIKVSSDLSYKLNDEASMQFGGIYNNSYFNAILKLNDKNGYKEQNFSTYFTFRYANGGLNSYAGVQLNRDERENFWSNATQTLSDKIWNWQPYFNLGYNISQNHRLSTSFQTYYQRPSYRDLMPYTTSSSDFLYRLGNPNLKNSTRYNLSFTYLFMRAATLEVNLSNENNAIVEYITPHNGGYALTKTNLDNSKYLRFLAGFPLPIIHNEDGIKWTATTYAALHFQKDKGMINNADYHNTFEAYYLQHKEAFILPHQWYLDAQITYYSPLFSGVYKTQSQWWVDFSVSKRINNWKISLTGYDLFNTNIAQGEIQGLNQPINFRKNWYSPKITLGVTLLLGNKELKSFNKNEIKSDARINESVNESIELGNNR